MTLHIRQPLPTAEIEHFVESHFPDAPATGVYKNHVKRALDVALVIIMAVPVLLLLTLVALCVAMDGKSPIYLQKRVGRGGRIFNMVKLRSMVADAEALLDAHLASDPAARAEWDRTQKLRDDPRITRVGRIIRKTSIDELPQLWNVLTGDMSLVGPRPMMVDQQALYPGKAYYALRPGITGYWQTSVRNESSFADRARYDAAYLRDVSLGTDMNVMVKTVGVVVNATGC